MDSAEDRPSLVAEEKDKQPVPFSDAPSPVRAVLNRPWPSAVVIRPEDNPSGKYRTLVATAKDIGDPISPEEMAALEDKEGDDAGTRFYKAAARANVVMRNYIHEHGSLYMDENGKYMIDNSAQVEEIRCKHVTAEEMESEIMKQEMTKEQTYLSELALASFNKRRKVKFELCETLLSRLFYESSRIFTHLNFVAKRKDKKKLFFAEIEDCGQGGVEILEVRCCVPLDSLCEGGYYYYCDDPRRGCRKGFDFTRCYGCSEFLKHPVDGSTYSGGHDHRRRNYIV
ncbi:uncharacterized protein [Aegilops tauschii subsp. strangulata]|uniref:uncharacterized protein n=1 Tax=Aegilops tauschii subsp. strangulata TaxID=200361 RepID=UPI00098A4434|nr:uncharacterized protein LOC109752420 [Aegilops tauschii subsp. strangulata]XP_044438912.1 uncharacterized protein LOC123165346 [Triticum aestivum]